MAVVAEVLVLTTTREKYLQFCQEHGLNPEDNRKVYQEADFRDYTPGKVTVALGPDWEFCPAAEFVFEVGFCTVRFLWPDRPPLPSKDERKLWTPKDLHPK